MVFPWKVQTGGPADQLFSVPRVRLREFIQGIKFFSTFGDTDLKRLSLHYMHIPQALGDMLCYATERAGVQGIPKSGVDGNSAKEGNPLMKMMGRPEAEVKWHKWWTYWPQDSTMAVSVRRMAASSTDPME